MVYIISLISGRKTWVLPDDIPPNKSGILKYLELVEGTCKVMLTYRGRLLSAEVMLDNDASVTASLLIYGGKGGFGSMLRAIGAQIEKTTNREACRDLSGRRLRDINNEKRVKDLISKRAEKEREMLQDKKKKMEHLKETPKHIFEDKSYFEQREKTEQDLYDSIDKALGEPSSSSVKRSLPERSRQPKKKLRMFDHLDDTSEESSDDENDHKLIENNTHVNNNEEDTEEKIEKENITEVYFIGDGSEKEETVKINTICEKSENDDPVLDVRESKSINET